MGKIGASAPFEANFHLHNRVATKSSLLINGISSNQFPLDLNAQISGPKSFGGASFTGFDGSGRIAESQAPAKAFLSPVAVVP
ncbi:hypothetical protein LJR235_001647 [Pararhizobium sp. LjRoot235]|uniref:hypothetical protein n=1 Tax=Pararhizobium sp. LjRoot235 TaxID=3342291 RepID=UPI003ECD1BDA